MPVYLSMFYCSLQCRAGLGGLVVTLLSNNPKLRPPLWPCIIAPCAAGIYYLTLKLAFAESITAVMGQTDLFDVPHWGSNWTFRIAAEAISTSFGTFIAASLAPGRERQAAIIGGCAISAGFLVKLFLFYASSEVSIEPWYQHLIDGLMVIGAPIIGSFVAESAEELHGQSHNGVGGIHRLHFVWLWLVVYFYALGLITPVARIYGTPEASFITTFVTLVVNAIPALAFAVPGYYGLALLAGEHGGTMHVAGRNLVAVMVLVFGAGIGAGIQLAWYLGFEKLFGAIFGSA